MTMPAKEAAKVLRDVRRFLSDTLKDEEYESPIAGWIDGVDAAVAALEAVTERGTFADAVDLLRAMVDVTESDCRFDSNGYCQSHNLDHQIDGCRVAASRAFLAALESPHPRERALSEDAARGSFRAKP